MKYLLILVLIAFLLLLSGCDEDSPVATEENQPPEIQSITSNPSTSSTNRLPGGDTVRVIVVATYPDQDELSYTWSTDEGRFIGDANESTVQWEAPIHDTEGDYVIEVIVSDGTLTAEGEITIYVDKANPPAVTTAEITEITKTSARGGGEVTEEGGSSVTVRGVVWSTASNPTLDANDGYTIDGSGTGSFTSYITQLDPDTEYYVRAYALNSQGTAYGNQINFKTSATDHETGTVTDIDGNIYQTVKIGDQWWMAENLRTTRYQNGDAIPTNLSNTQWQNTTSGAYTIYPHDGGGISEDNVEGINSDEEMVAAYGKLYNWYAVDDSRGLCPPGWLVPSDTDWKQLEMYLGMSEQDANLSGSRGSPVGGKLKSTRTDPDAPPGWKSPNTGATNESGFSGFPGGFSDYFGTFSSIGYHGYWWSSSEKQGWLSAFSRSLNSHHSDVYRKISDMRDGLSVRCIRDD